MSRPEKTIDWEKVDQLLLSGCYGNEICPHFDMHPDTFYRRVLEKYNMGFTDYSSLKKSQGDSLLKAKQFEKAMKLDNTMLIWLGKQRLGQKENMQEFMEAPKQAQINKDHENIELKAKLQIALEELGKLRSNAS